MLLLFFCCFLKCSCEYLDLISVENINFWGNIEAWEREGSDILCVSSVIRDVSPAGLKRRYWSVTLLRLLLTCEAGAVCCHSQKSDRDCLALIKCGALASEGPHPLGY